MRSYTYYILYVLIFDLIIVLISVILDSDYIRHILILFSIYSILVIGWNIQYGLTGLLNFGYGAIFGASAYISAIISMKMNLSPWVSLVFNMFITPILTLPLGLATLKLKHPTYFAIISLAFGEILRLSVIELEDITRGQRGLWGIPAFTDIYIPLLGHISFQHKSTFLFFAMLIEITVIVLYFNLFNIGLGLRFMSIKTDHILAESLGINTFRYKLISLSLGSSIAGIAGSLYAHYIQVLSPDLLSPLQTFQIFTMSLFGGADHPLGPILGVGIYFLISEILRPLDIYRFIILGSLIIIIIVFYPKGVSRLIDKITRTEYT
jgi:branched-chain amino acid transport system permease protein